MTPISKLRVSTIDTPHAVDITCAAVEGAVGLPVRAELQELEGGNVIIELQLGERSVHTPHPSRLASSVDKAVGDVEVLSSWNEPGSLRPTRQRCPEVIGVDDKPLSEVAQRAFDNDLPTAKWDRSDTSWHLAVPSICCDKALVGLSHRRGYEYRFTVHDATALRRGIDSQRAADAR